MTNEEAIAVLEEQSNFNRRFQHYFEASSVEIRKDKVVSPMLVAERYRELADALDVAISALRADGEKCDQNATEMRPDLNNPLTMEQLREMDGQPVWIVESPDWGHWELSEDAEDYICDRDTDLYGLTYPDPDGKAGLHKLGWVAYAYQTAHIDREAWKPCLICSAQKMIINSGYCPHCGRPLTEEAWLELEKRVMVRL